MSRTRSAFAGDVARRHGHHLCLGALVAGLSAAGASTSVPSAAVAVAAAVVVAAFTWIRAVALGLACAGLVAGGAVLGEARLAALDAPHASIAGGLAVDARATLLEHPRRSPFGSSARIELLDGKAAGAGLLARAGEGVRWPADASPGDEVRVAGFAGPAESDPDADFDWAAHLERQGVAGELELSAVRVTDGARTGPLGIVDDLRERSERALATGVSGSQAALIRGMVLGQDGEIDALVKEDFRGSGLAHILAVSGQNVLLLCMLALPLLAALGLGPRARAVAMLALIGLYVPLAGAGPSLQRAGAMGAAGLVALAAGRPSSRSYGLLLAAAATLAVNPRVCGDVGWQLSFAAVVGILTIAPRLRRALSALPRLIAEGIAVTVAATVSTAPLLMHRFGEASVSSLPANLLALPAVAPAMWIGMAQIVIGQASGLGSPFSTLADAALVALGAVNGVLLDYIAEVARRLAEPSWSVAEVGLSSAGEVAGAYLAIAVLTVTAVRLARRAGPAVRALAGRWRAAQDGSRVAALTLVATAAAAVSVAGHDAGPPDRLTVSFLDVGQGDATLVQDPQGAAVLIDAGPAEARAYRLVQQAGVERLDLVVATHAAADHHGGMLEVLQRLPVEVLLDGGDGTRDESFRALLAEAERRGVKRLPAEAGQVLRMGSLTVEVLWPEQLHGPPPDDPNLRAVTTVISAGDFELLVSGDAESPSLAGLELPDVDLLKVPHHGSEDEGLPELLERLRPEIAAIGVGKDNGYGHPTPSTLEALEDAGAGVYRTDVDGTIEVSVADGGLSVETQR